MLWVPLWIAKLVGEKKKQNPIKIPTRGCDLNSSLKSSIRGAQKKKSKPTKPWQNRDKSRYVVKAKYDNKVYTVEEFKIFLDGIRLLKM